MSRIPTRGKNYYRLMFPEYKKAAETILGSSGNKHPLIISANSKYSRKLEEVGLLNIWFELISEDEIKSVPVEKDEKMVSPGEARTIHETLDFNTWYQSVEDETTILLHRGPDVRGWGWIKAEWGKGRIKTPEAFKLADLDHVEAALLEEARIKGFVEGVYIRKNDEVVKLNGEINVDLGDFAVIANGTYENGYSTQVVLTKGGFWKRPIDIKDNTWYEHKKYGKTLIYHTNFGNSYGILNDGRWFTEADFQKGKIGTTIMAKPDDWEETELGYVAIRLFEFGKENGYIPDNITDWNFNGDINSIEVWVPSPLGGFYSHTQIALNADKWRKVKPKTYLPRINGYDGSFEMKHNGAIVYGECGIMRAEWFTSSKTRNIKSMTLSSGVTIDEQQMDQIREYLKNHDQFGEMMEQYSNRTNGAVSMKDF